MKVGKYFVFITLLIFLALGLNGCKSNKEPTASFLVSPGSGESPLEVVVDASSSGDEDGIIDSYEWDFGDGMTSGGRIVKHTYSNDGDYTISLTVTDNDGAIADATKTVSVQNRKPIPQLVAEPQKGEVPLKVSFDLSGSKDRDGVIEEFKLDFGDSSQPRSGTDMLQLLNHTYQDAGEYVVKLTVVDDDDTEGSTTKEIIARTPPPPNKEPTARISTDTTSGTGSLVVDFSARNSSDPDGEIEGYEWDFGDGNVANGVEVSHRFQRAGEFDVSLVVTDNRGGTAKDSQTITVKPVTYFVGESASNGFVRVTLQDASIVEEIDDEQADSGKEFVIVDIAVRALQDGQYPSKTLNFKLTDSSERPQPVSLATAALDDYFRSGMLDKDDMAKGKIAFEGRKSSDFYILTYQAPGQSPIQFKIRKK